MARGNDPVMDDAPTRPLPVNPAAQETMLDSDTFIAVAGTILVRDAAPDSTQESEHQGDGVGRLPPPPPYGSLIATSSASRRSSRRRTSASGDVNHDRGTTPRRRVLRASARP